MSIWEFAKLVFTSPQPDQIDVPKYFKEHPDVIYVNVILEDVTQGGEYISYSRVQVQRIPYWGFGYVGYYNPKSHRRYVGSYTACKELTELPDEYIRKDWRVIEARIGRTVTVYQDVFPDVYEELIITPEDRYF